MTNLIAVALAEFQESLRARWFYLYTLIFGGAMILLFILGLTESQVMGFTGLSRLLVTYIQLCVAVLPLFILITTVRSVVGERESNVLEYFLALPISLGDYYWGKLLTRFLVVFLPVFLTLMGALIWGLIRQLEIPWEALGYYAVLLGSLTWCFLGLGMLISAWVRKQEWAMGLAFMIWLSLLAFLDFILIGVMLQHQVNEKFIVILSLLNPMQTFRTGTMLLFDAELSVLGPAAYVILDNLGKTGFLTFSLLYPLLLGWSFAWLGFMVFKHGDLL